MSLRAKIIDNPFYVLELAPTCARADIERAQQVWLAKLELSLQSAMSYATPLGRRPRTPEAVRKAADELRDPVRRIAHEFWMLRGDRCDETPSEAAEVASPPPDALVALGLRAPR